MIAQWQQQASKQKKGRNTSKAIHSNYEEEGVEDFISLLNAFLCKRTHTDGHTRTLTHTTEVCAQVTEGLCSDASWWLMVCIYSAVLYTLMYECQRQSPFTIGRHRLIMQW